MPVSATFTASGLLAATAILAAALFYMPAAPAAEQYEAAVKLAAGIILITGSLLLSRAIGATFLRRGGSGSFKALYLASLASAGAGASEAASVFFPANVRLAAALAALSLSGAGMLILFTGRGGA